MVASAKTLARRKARGKPLRMEMGDDWPMSAKQALFFKHYLETNKNGFEAFRRMDPSHVLMPKQSIDKRVRQIMLTSGIKNALRKLAVKENAVTERIMNKYAISQERIKEELAKIAFTNVDDVAEWGPDGVKFKSSAELTEEAKASIAEVGEQIFKDGNKVLKIKNYDKQKALEALARSLGMFKEVVDHNHKALSVNFIIEGKEEPK